MTKNIANHKRTYTQRQPAQTEQGIPDSTLELIARLDPTFFPATSAARRALAQDRPVSLGRHQRKCSVCRHPERDAIEEDFLRWRSPSEIAQHYGLSDWSVVYRHVRAFGLFAERRRNARFALESIIERVNEIEVVTPGAVIAAVRALTRINEVGEWVEPTKRVIVTHITVSEESLALSAIEQPPAPEPAATPPTQASAEAEKLPKEAEVRKEKPE